MLVTQTETTGKNSSFLEDGGKVHILRLKKKCWTILILFKHVGNGAGTPRISSVYFLL